MCLCFCEAGLDTTGLILRIKGPRRLMWRRALSHGCFLIPSSVVRTGLDATPASGMNAKGQFEFFAPHLNQRSAVRHRVVDLPILELALWVFAPVRVAQIAAVSEKPFN